MTNIINVCENMRFKTIVSSLALIAFIILLGLPEKVAAQTYQDARKYAFNGEREKARTICRQILSQDFNSDVALLLGRTYAWDGEYDSARVVFNKVMILKPENMEVLDAFIDVEYWSENYAEAVKYCDLSLAKDSMNEAMILKKARILYSSEEIESAVVTLEDYIEIYSEHSEVLKKLKDYRLDLMKNSIKLSYTFDYYEETYNRDPWHLLEISYRRKTKLGSVIGRVNYAKRFGNTAFQYEVDAYPSTGEKSYLYMNYGFADNSLFPDHRMGLEWFRNFPNAFEGSLGMRMLFFGSSEVDIYTATIGKYISNYWVSLRSYVTPGTEGTSVSGSLQTRRYFSDPENYIGLRVSYGISPDENRNWDVPGNKLTMEAWSASLGYNHIFNRRWVVKVGGKLGSEELVHDTFSNYFTVDITLSHLF